MSHADIIASELRRIARAIHAEAGNVRPVVSRWEIRRFATEAQSLADQIDGGGPATTGLAV